MHANEQANNYGEQKLNFLWNLICCLFRVIVTGVLPPLPYSSILHNAGSCLTNNMCNEMMFLADHVGGLDQQISPTKTYETCSIKCS